MSEEIKEMSKIELFLLDLKCSTEPTLTEKGKELLLDYITNLQNRIKELEEINKQHQELNGKLRKENKELKEYKENATRKHWQQKCAEHSINEKLLQIRIDKAIEYINKNKHLSMFADCREPEKDWNYDLECSANDLLNILQDKEEV